MKRIPLYRAISLALGCCAMLNVGAAFAQDADTSPAEESEEEEESVGVNQVMVGLQADDSEGDLDNLERNSDGLDDGAVIELLRLSGESDRKYYYFEGRDLGQQDQTLDFAGGIYGKLKVKASWVEQFRNYTDGVSLGGQFRPNYWAVSDATQALLETGFVPQNTNPTPAGESDGIAGKCIDRLAGAGAQDRQTERRVGSDAGPAHPGRVHS
jgi:hypothetical protein